MTPIPAHAPTSHSDRHLLRILSILLVMASACPILHAQEFFERFDAWPVELRIQGTILLAPSPSGMARYLNSNELKLNEIDLVLIDLNGTPTTNPEQSDRSSLSTELLSRFASVKQIPVVTSEATESDSKQLVIAESLADLKIHETTMLLVMDNSPPDTIRPPTWDLLKKVFQQTLDAQGIIGWAGPSFRALGSSLAMTLITAG